MISNEFYSFQNQISYFYDPFVNFIPLTISFMVTNLVFIFNLLNVIVFRSQFQYVLVFCNEFYRSKLLISPNLILTVNLFG